MTLLEAGPKKLNGDDVYAVRFKVVNGTNKEIGIIRDASLSYDFVYTASQDGQSTRLGTWDDAKSPNRDLIAGGMAYITLIIQKNDVPKYRVTRILWRPDPNEINKDLPWAKLKNMEFALECPKK